MHVCVCVCVCVCGISKRRGADFEHVCMHVCVSGETDGAEYERNIKRCMDLCFLDYARVVSFLFLKDKILYIREQNSYPRDIKRCLDLYFLD